MNHHKRNHFLNGNPTTGWLMPAQEPERGSAIRGSLARQSADGKLPGPVRLDSGGGSPGRAPVHGPCGRLKSFWAVLIIGGLVAVSGCSKKASTAGAPPQPVAQAQAVVDTNAPNQSQPSLVQADGQPDFAALNRTLKRWVFGHRRPPANFDEFAATAGVSIPPPPAGKKYVITKNMHVELANR